MLPKRRQYLTPIYANYPQKKLISVCFQRPLAPRTMLSTYWRECRDITKRSKKINIGIGGGGEGSRHLVFARQLKHSKKLRLIIRGVGRLDFIFGSE